MGLGHEVSLSLDYTGQDCEAPVALHARRSYPSIRGYRDARPNAPLIVALTGTDLYSDLAVSADAQESVALADRLVGLQERGALALEEGLRSKVRVIRQSMEVPAAMLSEGDRPGNAGDHAASFDLCLVAHLRDVKAPLRAALATRLLPEDSRIKVIHYGEALDEEWERRARDEQEGNPRYEWRGAASREAVWREMHRARAVLLTSKLEGGANVVSEAMVLGKPVLCSRVEGSVGMLGVGYEGYFEASDERGLAELMLRFEKDAGLRERLGVVSKELAGLYAPRLEREAWGLLLGEFVG